MRDRVRYHDDVFCAGGSIAEELNRRAGGNNNNGNTENTENTNNMNYVLDRKYVAFHIRRGDFQHKHVKIPAQEIIESTIDLIPNPAEKIVYIATDEKNVSFFEPFRRHFKEVYFLGNFTGTCLCACHVISITSRAPAKWCIGEPMSILA